MFGSYNPPHQGHVATALKAKEKYGLCEVWMMPVPVSALKKGTAQASFDQKLEMCRILTAPEAKWLKVTADCADFKDGKIGQIQSIKRLLERVKQENEDAEFNLVCGSDFKEKYDKVAAFFSLSAFAARRLRIVAKRAFKGENTCVDRLLNRIERVGHCLRSSPALENERSRIVLNLEGHECEVEPSSSMLRKMMETRNADVPAIPPELMDFIQKENLYVKSKREPM